MLHQEMLIMLYRDVLQTIRCCIHKQILHRDICLSSPDANHTYTHIGLPTHTHTPSLVANHDTQRDVIHTQIGPPDTHTDTNHEAQLASYYR